MGDTMSMSSKCSGQFSQMGSQRLLLLFRKDAHIRITTRPACASCRLPVSKPSNLYCTFLLTPCLSRKAPFRTQVCGCQGCIYMRRSTSGNKQSCKMEAWAMLAWLGGLSGKQALR